VLEKAKGRLCLERGFLADGGGCLQDYRAKAVAEISRLKSALDPRRFIQPGIFPAKDRKE
jgi:hypothetical protein